MTGIGDRGTNEEKHFMPSVMSVLGYAFYFCLLEKEDFLIFFLSDVFF